MHILFTVCVVWTWLIVAQAAYPYSGKKLDWTRIEKSQLDEGAEAEAEVDVEDGMEEDEEGAGLEGWIDGDCDSTGTLDCTSMASSILSFFCAMASNFSVYTTRTMQWFCFVLFCFAKQWGLLDFGMHCGSP